MFRQSQEQFLLRYEYLGQTKIVALVMPRSRQLSLVFSWPPKEHLNKITNSTLHSAFSCLSPSLSSPPCGFCRRYHMLFLSFPCWGPSHPSNHHFTYVACHFERTASHYSSSLNTKSHAFSFAQVFFFFFSLLYTYLYL